MMASNALRVLVPGLLLPLVMGHAGGWAVITVDDLPDAAEAGKPITLSYMVRQHGMTPLGDLRGHIEATSGRLSATGTVRESAPTGRYTASLTLPSAGEWSITIRSGFGKSDVTLLPLTVVDPGASLTRPVADADRGRRLFVAKGCVTCHVQIGVGPNLDGKRFDATYLASFLAKPTAPQPGKPAMPNLGLAPREIASLVTYLNGNRQVGTR
jgi:mono/diheme cytochrome c family protein